MLEHQLPYSGHIAFPERDRQIRYPRLAVSADDDLLGANDWSRQECQGTHDITRLISRQPRLALERPKPNKEAMFERRCERLGQRP